jgi:hypothetical protein
MSSESPASILFSSDGYELAVQNNVALPTGVRSLVAAGIDGGNVVRPNLSDTSGRLVTVGAGTAGTPAGGVITIQGVTSMTALTVAQATAASLNATVVQGTAAANSGGWPVKITDGTNNPAVVNAAPTTEYGLVVRNIPSGSQTVISGTAANFLAQVSQPTAASLNATVVQGTAAANSGGWPVKITDGTNNPAVLNAAPTTEYGLVVRNIPSGSQTVISGTAANFLAQVSQPTAASLNATVVQGTAAANSGAWTVKITDGTNNPAVMSSSPAGTEYGLVTRNIPSGSQTVISGTAANFLAQVSQPTAASLNATVIGSGSAGSPSAGVVTVQGIAGGTAIPVSGTITVAKATSSTVTSVAASTSNVTLLAVNANRLGASIYNDSNSLLYVKLGATASTSSYTIKLFSQSYWEIPTNYTGIIDGIWANSNGSARIDELAP